MKIEQLIWSLNSSRVFSCSEGFGQADLVLVFGGREFISNEELLAGIRRRYEDAHIVGCTTSGEILGTMVFDNSLTTTAVQFEATKIETASVSLEDPALSYEAGEELANFLHKPGLAHVFVLSEGLNINGSRLAAGMKAVLPNNISITGGLAGDGVLFSRTMTVADGYAKQNIVTAIGLYGDRIRIGFGSFGGWDPFGIDRLITKSSNNVLYEMDGKSVIDLYDNYLGEHAKDLPASGLLFPLSIRSKDSDKGLVRTILGINRQEKSMTFAGDVPEGYYAKLMKANIDSLVNGAQDAAELSRYSLGSEPELAVLISCVGRKLVLNQRVEEEIEAVRDKLGEKCMFTGFYSYGEICPYTRLTAGNGRNMYSYSTGCELHNQTMTITTFMEESQCQSCTNF